MITQESSVEIHVVPFVEPPERLDLLENKFLMVIKHAQHDALNYQCPFFSFFVWLLKNIDDQKNWWR